MIRASNAWPSSDILHCQPHCTVKWPRMEALTSTISLMSFSCLLRSRSSRGIGAGLSFTYNWLIVYASFVDSGLSSALTTHPSLSVRLADVSFLRLVVLLVLTRPCRDEDVALELALLTLMAEACMFNRERHRVLREAESVHTRVHVKSS
jgi:hypothetical protein